MAINNIDVRQQNKKNIYKSILSNDKIPRLKIAEQLGLSLPTVGSSIKELIDEGLIRGDETMSSTGGRKASVVSAISDARIAIGIDITQNHVAFAAVNLKKEVFAFIRLSQKFSDCEGYSNDVQSLFWRFVQKNGIEKEKILGVGVSFPGIVNLNGERLLYSHRLGITAPSRPQFSDMLGVPSYFFNDATAASLAECSAVENLADFVFLSLSNSVGGAIIIDGKVLLGNSMRSGEFGHIRITTSNEKICYCGQKGHFDSYCSALVLAENTGGNLETFFKRLELGDEQCERIFSEYLDYLSLMICNLRTAFNIPVILGGYVGSYLAPYIEEIRSRVVKMDTFQENTDDILLCTYKAEGAAAGAAIHFINNFIEKI